MCTMHVPLAESALFGAGAKGEKQVLHLQWTASSELSWW